MLWNPLNYSWNFNHIFIASFKIRFGCVSRQNDINYVQIHMELTVCRCKWAWPKMNLLQVMCQNSFFFFYSGTIWSIFLVSRGDFKHIWYLYQLCCWYPITALLLCSWASKPVTVTIRKLEKDTLEMSTTTQKKSDSGAITNSTLLPEFMHSSCFFLSMK